MSVDLAHYEIVHAKVGMRGVIQERIITVILITIIYLEYCLTILERIGTLVSIPELGNFEHCIFNCKVAQQIRNFEHDIAVKRPT